MNPFSKSGLSRREIAAYALTAPAAIGTASWLAPWIAYGAAVYLSIGVIPDTTVIQILFVLMILIGPATSIAAMILTKTDRFKVRFSLYIYLLNGAWLIISFAAIFMLVTGR